MYIISIILLLVLFSLVMLVRNNYLSRSRESATVTLIQSYINRTHLADYYFYILIFGGVLTITRVIYQTIQFLDAVVGLSIYIIGAVVSVVGFKFYKDKFDKCILIINTGFILSYLGFIVAFDLMKIIQSGFAVLLNQDVAKTPIVIINLVFIFWMYAIISNYLFFIKYGNNKRTALRVYKSFYIFVKDLDDQYGDLYKNVDFNEFVNLLGKLSQNGYYLPDSMSVLSGDKFLESDVLGFVPKTLTAKI